MSSKKGLQHEYRVIVSKPLDQVHLLDSIVKDLVRKNIKCCTIRSKNGFIVCRELCIDDPTYIKEKIEKDIVESRIPNRHHIIKEY